MDKIVVYATFLVLLGCFLWSAYGESAEERCEIGNEKRGVCTTYSNCSSVSSMRREFQPVICRFEGDIAYICCELSESESGTMYDSLKRDIPNQKGDSSSADREDEEDMDRFFDYNRGRNRVRGWNGERITEGYSKIRGGKDGNYIPGNGRGGDFNLYFTTSKQPIWSQSGESGNTFILPYEKGTFNTAYQNHKAQGSYQFNGWNQQSHQRPQFSNNGNSNAGWQENQNYYGNYDNRRTTERSRTTTSRIILPADFRPNPRPDFNRPQNFNSGGHGPENSFFEGSKPNNYFSGDNRPVNVNSGGSRPNNRPQNMNSFGKRPQSSFLGSSRPNNQFTGDSRPQNQFSSRKRISELKCDEYTEAVSVKVLGLPLTPDPKPITINVEKCISAQQLIVGGENTTLGEFPHMAAIGFPDRKTRGIGWFCGGSLISDQYVLTAAHCTNSSSGEPVKVRLGEYILNKNDDGAHPEDYSILEIIKHPDYKPPSKYNDIALLKLSRRVEVRKHIRPACLHTKNDVSEPKVIAIGWGRVARDEKTSEVLLKVALSVIEKNTCNRAYYDTRRKGYIPQGIIDSQICAGELAGGKDTCQGDSGGPIEIRSKNNRCIHYIVGVTSFGKVCGIAESPGVYTRVSAYIPWIESIVWPQ